MGGLFDLSTKSETKVYNTTQTWQDSNNRVLNAPTTLSESGNTSISLPAAPGSAAVAAATSPVQSILPWIAGLLLIGGAVLFFLRK